jgi:hypothetical protein
MIGVQPRSQTRLPGVFSLSNLPDDVRFEWNRRAFEVPVEINDNSRGGKT